MSAKETNTMKLLHLPPSFKATIMIWEIPCGFAVMQSVVRDYKITSAFQDGDEYKTKKIRWVLRNKKAEEVGQQREGLKVEAAVIHLF